MDGNLKNIPTEQIMAELQSRDGVSIYNCDLYQSNNYRVKISKVFGDYGNISMPSKCDVIIVNRQSDRLNIFEK